mmetsp:Transcript_39003/g.108354  ORF Transcript_39003/g.108354 Transcript_39003/m.108354 type:complete len:172 (+) Transcript_39003:58-573(+)
MSVGGGPGGYLVPAKPRGGPVGGGLASVAEDGGGGGGGGGGAGAGGGRGRSSAAAAAAAAAEAAYNHARAPAPEARGGHAVYGGRYGAMPRLPMAGGVGIGLGLDRAGDRIPSPKRKTPAAPGSVADAVGAPAAAAPARNGYYGRQRAGPASVYSQASARSHVSSVPSWWG